jgi:hypothetical protein
MKRGRRGSRKRKVAMNVHHRKPRSIGGSDSWYNKVRVKVSEHNAWHHLFQNWDVETIIDRINSIWIDPDYELVLVERNRLKKTA